MLIGDITIAKVLTEELIALRSDARAQADLFSNAPLEVQESARKYFSDPRNKIDIRQGFSTEVPKNPTIVIVLAGEEEGYTPIGGSVASGYDDQDEDRLAITLYYTGTNKAKAILDVASGELRTEVYNPYSSVSTRVPTEEFVLKLSDYASLTLLTNAINAITNYSADLVTAFASLSTDFMFRAELDWINDDGYSLYIAPSVYGEVGGTFFRGTWKITAMSVNSNITLWLHAFTKWALLKRRIDLEVSGMLSAQLAGGDFEPVPEWVATNDVAVFARGVLLTAIYFAQFVERSDVEIIKSTDVHEFVPTTGVGLIE